MPSEVELAGTAYSYIRFSSAEQERGDSLRRQKMLRDDWLKRHPQVSLDTNLSLQDLGISAVRVASAWRERQRLAAEGKGIVTTRCPAWLVAKGGKFEFKPGAKETIRRIFAASRAGHGSRSIARDLLADRVPHFCDGVWNHTYVRQLLVCRSVIGEMQPYRRADGKRVKDGP